MRYNDTIKCHVSIGKQTAKNPTRFGDSGIRWTEGVIAGAMVSRLTVSAQANWEKVVRLHHLSKGGEYVQGC